MFGSSVLRTLYDYSRQTCLVRTYPRDCPSSSTQPLRYRTLPRPPPATATAAAEITPIDEDRRKQVAEQLLEKASRRATEAKAGLKAAAASARRDAGKDKAADPAADSGVGQPDPQFIAASS